MVDAQIDIFGLKDGDEVLKEHGKFMRKFA